MQGSGAEAQEPGFWAAQREARRTRSVRAACLQQIHLRPDPQPICAIWGLTFLLLKPKTRTCGTTNPSASARELVLEGADPGPNWDLTVWFFGARKQLFWLVLYHVISLSAPLDVLV